MTLRIGIPLAGGAGWHGGITYIASLIAGFQTLPVSEAPELFILIDSYHSKDFPLFSDSFREVSGIILIGNEIKKDDLDVDLPVIAVADLLESSKYIDYMFPINFDALPGYAFSCWIPDLQHKTYPEFFKSDDIAARESKLNYVLENSKSIIVSSESVRNDILRNYEFKGKIDVIHFYSRFDMNALASSDFSVYKEFALPKKYFICCNQFWAHKNHETLFKALSLVDDKVHVVFTGAKKDYRNEGFYNYLEKLIDHLKIRNKITILGFIPREQQLHLIRNAVAVIQPSLFEGWSTVLEDARIFNKEVICSNIDVHKEQNLSTAHYFDPLSTAELAHLINEAAENFKPVPDAEGEKAAEILVRNYQKFEARKLLEIAQRVVNDLNEMQSAAATKNDIDRLRINTSQILDMSFGLNILEDKVAYQKQNLDIALIEMEHKERSIGNLLKEVDNKASLLHAKRREIGILQVKLDCFRTFNSLENPKNFPRKLLGFIFRLRFVIIKLFKFVFNNIKIIFRKIYQKFDRIIFLK